jgi:serine/threonine protein kinase
MSVAHALAYAHGAADAEGRPLRIVHRDVSPSNILVSWEGDVKLADFGIAYALRRLDVTHAGIAKGKVAYMAPEQARGDTVDGRADLFSLACVMHKMLVGYSPLERLDNRTVAEMGERFPMDDAVPEDLVPILERARHPARDRRYRDAGELALHLGRVLAARIDQDARAVLCAWLDTFRTARSVWPPSEKRANRAGELLDVELLLRQNSSAEGRRFDSVVSAGSDLSEDETVEERDLVSNATVRADLHFDSWPTRYATKQVVPTSWALGVTRTSEPDQAGQKIGGFRLESAIENNGASKLFRARHVRTGREVLLRLLTQAALDRSEELRLQREVEALSLIEHPTIPGLIDWGTHQGVPCLVTEPARGRRLDEIVEERGRMQAEQVVTIAKQIAAGLAAAHEVGVVHRNLGASKILLFEGPGGPYVKILAFVADRPRGTSMARRSGKDLFVEDAEYAAPEQIRDEHEVGPSADLYALGIIVYLMLSGGLPFAADTVANLIELHLNAEPRSLPPLHGLEELVSQLLQKDPAKRPQNAVAVMRELDRIATRMTRDRR